MAMKSGGLDWWRNYFRTVNSDIFDIIENAITLAALDCPKEFKLRRDGIAERLFTCELTRCSGCDRVEFSVPRNEEDEGFKSGSDRDACEFDSGGGVASKESKVNSTTKDGSTSSTKKNMNQESNFGYGEAEALTNEMEEEGQTFAEVLRIKKLLQNSEDELDSVLFESLRRLQLMDLTLDILKATEIGKAVNGLRKHVAKDIRHLARTLINEWKDMVDEWVNATSAIAGTPDSVNPSVLDEEDGLPSPPLDEGIFFATQPTSMELSQFFDGMDDDGNPQNNGELVKNQENGRKPSMQKQTVPKLKPQYPDDANVRIKDSRGQLITRREAFAKPNKPLNTESGHRRPQKLGVGQNVTFETKYQENQEKAVFIQKRPLAGRQNNKCIDEDVVQMKLEATKRKLHERYQQAENAKKQRTIQVMELRDLPKQGLGHRNPHMKPGNHNPHWTNGRR